MAAALLQRGQEDHPRDAGDGGLVVSRAGEPVRRRARRVGSRSPPGCIPALVLYMSCRIIPCQELSVLGPVKTAKSNLICEHRSAKRGKNSLLYISGQVPLGLGFLQKLEDGPNAFPSFGFEAPACQVKNVVRRREEAGRGTKVRWPVASGEDSIRHLGISSSRMSLILRPSLCTMKSSFSFTNST